jgi:hypothetical protein
VIVKNYNPDIIFVRTYNGTLIPITRVQLVTTDPNNGKVQQEIPLEFCIKKLMHHNMNNYETTEDNWQKIDNYNIVEKR